MRNPIKACPSCGCTEFKQVAGTGPHHAALRCAECNRFIRWLPKPAFNVVPLFPQDGGNEPA